ncbi:hypothetical protein [Novosphingobium sp. ERN07]|uniref:hypothetical protein n=1 Tax=Novosphingobium sp. ERN07 TaxID=2726187 RepID=UPI00145656ED|nr:hypothetical protein [Novosphingobium sp. ERN07]
MHTVRNRVASRPRPPSSRSRAKVAKSKSQVVRRKEPAFLLRIPNPPAFPAHLILPAPRGAVISTMPGPEAPVAKRSIAPKKPRKAAKNRKGTMKGTTKGSARVKACKITATPVTSVAPQKVPTLMTTPDLLDRALAIQPAPEANFRSAPKPLRTAPNAPEAPLPRAQAPAIARSGGLIEAIGNWLRQTGNLLARWRARRRQPPAERLQLAQAAARQRALQSQFEALEALGEAGTLNRAS